MDDDNKKKLINETVTGRRLTPRRAARYAAIAAICGVAFSVAAGITYPLMRHVNDRLEAHDDSETKVSETAYPEQTDTDDTVNDAADSPDSEAPAGSTGGKTTDSPTTEPSDTGEAENGDSDVNNFSTNEPYLVNESEEADKSFQEISSVRYNAIDRINNSLITMTVTAQTSTWFDSEMESSETFSGIIISIDDKEILILAPYVDTDGKSIKVTFTNGSKADAYLKQSSSVDGLSVIAVSAADGISQETLDAISAVSYGDASALKCGMSVIAAGAPLGVTDSSAFGTIGYIADAEPGIDCAQYVFYSDISVNPAKGTFIIDYEGKLIGVASSVSTDVSSKSGYSRIVCTDSLERIINSMMNGNKKAYLGVIGMDVDFDMKYSSVPEGVYVSDVVNNSPAYNAGIRHGDVITAIAERSVTDIASMSRIINGQKPGVTINIKLMRGSVNSEYREMEFELVLGER